MEKKPEEDLMATDDEKLLLKHSMDRENLGKTLVRGKTEILSQDSL